MPQRLRGTLTLLDNAGQPAGTFPVDAPEQGAPPPPPPPATGTHSGRVVNATNNQAIAGATVRLGTVWTGTTGPDGAFASGPVPPGTYQREITATGFVTERRDITIIAGQNVHAGARLNPVGPPPPPPPSPSIVFTATPQSIPAGGSADLSWSVRFATTIAIDQGIGAVAADGARRVTPAATTTYTLTATGAGGTRTAQIIVTVAAPPPPPPPPGPVTFSGPVRLTNRYQVNAGARAVFDPNVSTTVEVDARNFVVLGELVMRPARPDVVHTLRFLNVNEGGFVGGGMDEQPADVGLWVMGAGRLDVQGTPKRGWTWLAGAATRGQRSITLAHDPTGWAAGDTVIIAPTGMPSRTAPDSLGRTWVVADWESFDRLTVDQINGRTISFREPLRFDHPTATAPDGTVFTAEVANLTRNVRIEGTPTGRTHVFIRSTRASTLRAFSVQHFGPRRPTPNEAPPSTTKVLGRYGLHIHHSFDGSRGTVVEDAVCFDGGNHAFVPHLSNGITFRDCVAFNAMEGLYWWDEPIGADPPWPRPASDVSHNASHDITYEDCLGALMRLDFRGSPAGQVGIFLMNAGNNTRAVRCRAVGAIPSSQVGGFHWNDDASDVRLVYGMGNVWIFQDCVAHNCGEAGISDWQNDTEPHVLERFYCYRNGSSGLDHGAYVNNYLFVDGFMWENGEQACINHALGHNPGRPGFPQTPNTLTYDRCHFGGGAVDTDHAFKFVEHSGASERNMQLRDCVFDRYTGAAIIDDPPQDTAEATVADFVRPQLRGTGQAFRLGQRAHRDLVIRCQPDPRTGTGAVRITHRNSGRGTFHAPWNANVESIAPFA